MLTLMLTAVNPELRATAAKAVRAAQAAADVEPGMESVRKAIELVDRVRAGHAPQVIVSEATGFTREQVEAAAAAFSQAVASSGAAEAETLKVSDPSDADLANDLEHVNEAAARIDPGIDVLARMTHKPTGRAAVEQAVTRALLEPIPPDYAPSREGSLTMAILMGACDGNAAQAFAYAKRLAVVSGHPDVYVDVCRAICAAYAFQPQADA